MSSSECSERGMRQACLVIRSLLGFLERSEEGMDCQDTLEEALIAQINHNSDKGLAGYVVGHKQHLAGREVWGAHSVTLHPVHCPKVAVSFRPPKKHRRHLSG